MTTTDTARDQAQAQLDHIRVLVDLLDHDSECDEADCNTVEEAQQAIRENALSVEVRSGWETPPLMDSGESVAATEYRILLCTGGPAVRIFGELNEHGEPESARLEYQDWGTPWTMLDTWGGGDADQMQNAANDLLRYVQQFHFGS